VELPSPAPIHILMRFADKLLSIDDTIAEHNRLIARHGTVWIGKLGKPLAERHIMRVNEQCRQNIPTYLYLVQKKGTAYQAYRATVVRMSRALPKREQNLVPHYYEERKITRYVGFWTKLSGITQIEKGQLFELHIASSLFAVPDTLARSMAALFVVREGQGIRS